MLKRMFPVLLAAMLLTTANHVFAQDGYNEPPQISLSQQERQLIESNNDFAFRLFREVRGNVSRVVSPLSITYALGMLNNGAAGLTQQEINQTLGFGEAGADAINQFCRKMLTESPLLDEQTRVMISNAIFINEPYHLLPAFQEKAETYYDATCQSRNFADGETMDVINQWGSDHTMGMIPRILTEQSFRPDAVSYLLDAVYFKGTWTLKFNKDETRDESFNGGELVPMMHMRNQLYYAENNDCQMLALPYGNEAYRMTILLPREGKTVGDVVAGLDGRQWSYYQWMPLEDVDVKLPRFETMNRIELVEPMSAIGMPSAFDPYRADIPYYCDQPQYISNMFQVAKIRLDEEGTEAAAITVVETETTSINPQEPKHYQFHADRPFLYIISEQSTGAIFFIGQYAGEGQTAPEPDGVSAPEAVRRSGSDSYDLGGRKLSREPGRGLYINEGRKVVGK